MGNNRPHGRIPWTPFEKAELDVLHTEILDSLPARRRSAFVLVRQDNLSYKLAGDIVASTPLAIRTHVFSAQQSFASAYRAPAFTSLGISSPPIARARSAIATSSRTHHSGE
jgi:hypothetical protein